MLKETKAPPCLELSDNSDNSLTQKIKYNLNKIEAKTNKDLDS